MGGGSSSSSCGLVISVSSWRRANLFPVGKVNCFVGDLSVGGEFAKASFVL